MCHMRDCDNLKVSGSQTCAQHQNRWYSHIVRYGCQSLLGIRRLLRRSEEENLEWLPNHQPNTQCHDEPAPTVRQANYFIAPRFNCVETLCAPCAVVVAWTKFAKSESPTNILNFLEEVYPTEESRPAYICIDKACSLLRTAISNGSWGVGRKPPGL